MADTLRDKFETWARDHLGQGYPLTMDEDVYEHPVTRWAFKAFIAGRASRPAEVDDEGLRELPEPFDHVDMADNSIRGVYSAEQYRQGQRDAVAADRSQREQTAEITGLLNNPPYGQPDLYSRLHTALTNEVELAKKFGKLPQWFDAVRGLVDWLESETGAAPSHTTNKQK